MPDKLVAKNIVISHQAYYEKRGIHRAKSLKLAKIIIASKKHLSEMFQCDIEKVLFEIRCTKDRNNFAAFFSSDNKIVLDPRMFVSISGFLATLCHELVHAEQYATGRLTVTRDLGRKWVKVWDHDGVKKAYPTKVTTRVAYLNRPWEKEAFTRMNPLANILIGKLRADGVLDNSVKELTGNQWEVYVGSATRTYLKAA